MRKWQVDYIRSHQCLILQTVTCDTVLKASLIEKGVLDEAEEQELSATGNTKGRYAETTLLLEILMTKRNGYISLMQALDASQQSDALSLLQKGEEKGAIQDIYNLQVKLFGKNGTVGSFFPSLRDHEINKLLEDPQIRVEYYDLYSKDLPLLNLHCQLSGPGTQYIERRVSNRMLIDPEMFKNTTEDVFVFKNISFNDLKDLVAPNIPALSGNQVLGISCSHILLEDDNHWGRLCKVSSQPLHRIFVDTTQVKQTTKNKVGMKLYFSATDILKNFLAMSPRLSTNTTLSNLVTRHGRVKSTTHAMSRLKNSTIVACRYMYVQLIYEMLCREIHKCDNLMSALMKMSVGSDPQSSFKQVQFGDLAEVNLYNLQRSTFITATVFNNSTRCRKYDGAYITEEVLVDSMITNTENNVVCVCDMPGMGKSCLLESLAKTLQSKVTNNDMVLFISLANFSEHLEKQMLGPDDHLSLLLKFTFPLHLESNLARRLISEGNGTIYVFLDGLDEVNPKSFTKVSNYLIDLLRSSNIKICMSSRLNKRTFLEETFGVVSYDIMPFPAKDQLFYVTEFWKQLYPQTDNDKLKELAECCIYVCSKLKQLSDEEILGLPLKCRMLAVVYARDAERLCSVGTRKQYSIEDILKLESICDLYNNFVSCCIEKAYITFSEDKQKKKEEWKNQLVSFYRLEALKLLYPEVAVRHLETTDALSISLHEMIPEISQHGLMTQKGNQLAFIHRTFAEYLVADYFADFWINHEHFTYDDFNFVGTYFIMHIMQAVPKPKKSLQPLGLLAKKVFRSKSMILHQLANYTLLWFMDGILKQYIGPGANFNFWRGNDPLIIGLLTSSQGVVTDAETSLRSFEDALRENAYQVFLICLEERFLGVLTLLKSLITMFPDRTSVLRVLTAHEKCFDHADADWLALHQSQISYAFLLHWISRKSTPDAADKIFRMFSHYQENYMEEFCMNFSKEYDWSPIDVSVYKSDLDMAIFLIDKINVSKDRLLAKCLAGDQESLQALEAKTKMFENLMDAEGSEPNFWNVAEMSKFLIKEFKHSNDLNVNLMKKLATKFRIGFKGLTLPCKDLLVNIALQKFNDYQLVDLLILLFEANKKSKDAVPLDIRRVQWKAEHVEEALNAELTQAFFKQFTITASKDMLINIKSLESVKLLLKFWNVTNCMHPPKYLHWAVARGNVEWVKYLIEKGFHVNELSDGKGTPIVSLPLENCVEITKLLVDNGADVFALGSYSKTNVADSLVEQFQQNLMDFDTNMDEEYDKRLHDWILFTIEMGYHELWLLRQGESATPLDKLGESVVWDNDNILLSTLINGIQSKYDEILFSICNRFLCLDIIVSTETKPVKEALPKLSPEGVRTLLGFPETYCEVSEGYGEDTAIIMNATSKLFAVSFDNKLRGYIPKVTKRPKKQQVLSLSALENLLTDVSVGKDKLSCLCKAALLKHGIEHYNDDGFVQLLLTLYLKPSRDMSHNDDFRQSAAVLDVIDVEELAQTFNVFQFDKCFQALHSIESLKVLLQICPDFSTCNTRGYNYMQWATRNKNTDWQTYLVKIGYATEETARDSEPEPADITVMRNEAPQGYFNTMRNAQTNPIVSEFLQLLGDSSHLVSPPNRSRKN